MISYRGLNLRNYHYFVIFFLIFLLLLFIIRYHIKIPVDINELIDFEIEAVIFINKFQYFGYSGNSTINIIAEKAGITEENFINLEELKATIPDKSGKNLIITSKKGDFNSTSEMAILRDDVVVLFDDKKIETEILYFEKKKNIVWTDKKFLLISDNLELNGDYFYYNLKDRKLLIKNQKSIFKGE